MIKYKYFKWLLLSINKYELEDYSTTKFYKIILFIEKHS